MLVAYGCRYGDLLMQQGRHEEAQDYYRSALKADPENRENLERYASFLASHDMDDALFYYQVSWGVTPMAKPYVSEACNDADHGVWLCVCSGPCSATSSIGTIGKSLPTSLTLF